MPVGGRGAAACSGRRSAAMSPRASSREHGVRLAVAIIASDNSDAVHYRSKMASS